MPGGAYVVRVDRVQPDLAHPEESTVLLDAIPTRPVDVAGFEISIKPFVNVLWLGGYMMFLGGILAWRRRAAIAARAGAKEPEPVPESKSASPGIHPRQRPALRPEPAKSVARE